MNDTAQERRHRLIGIALMCGAVLCFACLDSVAKFLSPHMPTMQIVWARNISGFLLTFVLMNPLTRPRILRTARPGLQIVRSLLLLATTLFISSPSATCSSTKPCRSCSRRRSSWRCSRADAG